MKTGQHFKPRPAKPTYLPMSPVDYKILGALAVGVAIVGSLAGMAGYYIVTDPFYDRKAPIVQVHRQQQVSSSTTTLDRCKNLADCARK